MDNMGRAAVTVIVTVRKEAHVVSTHSTWPTPLFGFFPNSSVAHVTTYLWSIPFTLPFISPLVIVFPNN